VQDFFKIPGNSDKLIAMSQFSRWNQISKYFLSSRSGDFLKLEFSNIISCQDKCEKLSRLLDSEVPVTIHFSKLNKPTKLSLSNIVNFEKKEFIEVL